MDPYLIETREEINSRDSLVLWGGDERPMYVSGISSSYLGFNFLLMLIWHDDDTLFHNTHRWNVKSLKFQAQIGTKDKPLITGGKILDHIVLENVSLKDKENMWYLTLTRYGVSRRGETRWSIVVKNRAFEINYLRKSSWGFKADLPNLSVERMQQMKKNCLGLATRK